MYTAHIHSIRERERETRGANTLLPPWRHHIMSTPRCYTAPATSLRRAPSPAQQQMSCRNGAMETRRKCRPYGSRFSYSLTSGMGDAAAAAAPSHYLFSLASSYHFRLVSPPQLVNMLTPNKKLNSDLTSRFSYSFSSYRQFRLRNNLISWGWFPFLVGSHDPSREKDKRN